MSNEVIYRKANKEDVPKAVDLINKCYRRKKNAEYFLWQYFAEDVPSVMMCGFAGDELVGIFGMQKKKLLPRNLVVGQAIDLLIAPEWRKKGHFAKLGQLAEECFPEADLLCVFPNVHGKNASVGSLNYEELGTIKTLVNLSNGVEKLVRTKSRRIDLAVDFSRKVEDMSLLRFSYDDRYRSWRYARNPIFSYSLVSLTSGEYGIVKTFEEPVSGKRFGDIVDFECSLDDRTKLMELFLGCCQFLRKEEGVAEITTWAQPHNVLYKALTAVGFSEIDQERYFCIKSIKANQADLRNFSRWHLVQADAEVY